MQTNQLMTMTFGDSIVSIEHKTKLGSLTELWAIGNEIRRSKGLGERSMENYLRSPDTLELVQAIERKEGIKSVDSTDLRNDKVNGVVTTIKSEIIKTKRGRHGGGTWAHMYILLDAAAWMDADFKVQMYDILINGKLLEWRDDSGDSFKTLNVVLDATVIKKEGRSPAMHIYIQVANAIKKNVNPTGGEWNTATHQELKRRTEIENHLITIMKLDLVNNIAHLLDIIKKI